MNINWEFFLQDIPWIILGIWTLYSIFALSFRKPKWNITGYYIIQHIPSTFITLGVLGTFAGVTFGLRNFDIGSDQIIQSIPLLLEGLKNAFYTSLYGLLASVLSGVVIRYQYSKGTLTNPEIQEQIQMQHNLEKVIDNFGKNLAEYNSDAIMGSLKQVIKDFNDTFTELIGELVTENFQSLTSSIDQLVEWQVEYREDINNVLESNEQLNKRTNDLLASFEKMDATISQISESSLQLKASLDSLKKSIEDESSLSGLVTQLETTTENLVSVSEDADMFKNEIEHIAKHLVDTQQEVKDWLNKEEGVLDAANAMNHTLIELRDFDVTQIEKLDKSFTNRLEETFENLDRLMKSYIQYLEDQNEKAA